MASQTTYYGKLLKPELGGGRVTVALGVHKFTSSATVCTLSVPMKNEIFGVQLGYKINSLKKGSRSIWTSGAISGGAIKIQRKTGSASGVNFFYKVMGY